MKNKCAVENFDLMCTATLRPELIKRTFDSHIKYLFKDHIKKAHLVLNIDMVGSDMPERSVDSILEYFDSIPFREITINMSNQPHFGQAFKWCLGQICEPLVFNLEEDWELSQELDFERMVELFEIDHSLVHLRLSMFQSYKIEGDTMEYKGKLYDHYEMKTWNKYIKWNGAFFDIPRNLRGVIGWAGHPSLNKTAFMLGFASVLDPNKNHEKQIKGHKPILLNSHFGVFHPPESPPAVYDIGRAWMKDHGFKKKGTKAFFVEWESV